MRVAILVLLALAMAALALLLVARMSFANPRPYLADYPQIAQMAFFSEPSKLEGRVVRIVYVDAARSLSLGSHTFSREDIRMCGAVSIQAFDGGVVERKADSSGAPLFSVTYHWKNRDATPTTHLLATSGEADLRGCNATNYNSNWEGSGPLFSRLKVSVSRMLSFAEWSTPEEAKAKMQPGESAVFVVIE